MNVKLTKEQWNVVHTALAYAAGQYARAGNVECADQCRAAYNKLAEQTKLRTGLPMYDRSDKL